MFCIAVFLDGRARMSIQGEEPLAVGPGMAVVQTGERGTRGWFHMPGEQNVRLVDIRYYPPGCCAPAALAALRPALSCSITACRPRDR